MLADGRVVTGQAILRDVFAGERDPVVLPRLHSAQGAFYGRLCSRMDELRANTAVVHTLARMVYFMLTHSEDYVDCGRENCEEQQLQRTVAALKRRQYPWIGLTQGTCNC